MTEFYSVKTKEIKKKISIIDNLGIEMKPGTISRYYIMLSWQSRVNDGVEILGSKKSGTYKPQVFGPSAQFIPNFVFN